MILLGLTGIVAQTVKQTRASLQTLPNVRLVYYFQQTHPSLPPPPLPFKHPSNFRFWWKENVHKIREDFFFFLFSRLLFTFLKEVGVYKRWFSMDWKTEEGGGGFLFIHLIWSVLQETRGQAPPYIWVQTFWKYLFVFCDFFLLTKLNKM